MDSIKRIRDYFQEKGFVFECDTDRPEGCQVLKYDINAKSTIQNMLKDFDDVLTVDIYDFADIICRIVYLYGNNHLEVDSAKLSDSAEFLCDDIRSCFDASKKLDDDNQNSSISGKTNYFLLTQSREGVDLDDYVCDKLYEDDIEALVKLIIEPPKSEFNEEVIAAIKRGDVAVAGAGAREFNNRIEKIMSNLRKIYSGTFGLHPYQGVLLFGGNGEDNEGYSICRDVILDPKLVTGRDTDLYRVEVCDSNNDVEIGKYNGICEVLKSKLPELSGDGINKKYTLDIERCIETDQYYPLLSFMLATRAVIDVEGRSGVSGEFRRSKASNWSDYRKGVDGEEGLESVIKTLVARCIYKATEKFYVFRDTGEPLDFKSETFAELYSHYEKTKKSPFGKIDKANGVNSLAELTRVYDNITRSLCKAFIVTDSDSQFDTFKLRISCTKQHISASQTSELFSGIDAFTGGSQGLYYRPGVVTALEDGESIVDFTFVRDTKLADAKPLFGFQAARLFQQNGTRITADNILIGEDENGESVFSTKGGTIHLQERIVHRFNAGSRSGKGVMTMNIIASMVASGALLFYIDRKPDMAGEFANITKGHMFLVNGGQVATKEDIHHHYDPHKGYLDGRAHPDFSKRYRHMTAVFKDDFYSGYETTYGDFVYWKAMIFVLGLVMARGYFMTAPNEEAQKVLGLGEDPKRFVIVLDEITNWHHNMESKYFPSDPKLGADSGNLKRYYKANYGNEDVNSPNFSFDEVKETLAQADITAFEALKQNYETASEAWHNSPEDKKLYSEYTKAQKDLEALIKKIEGKNKGKNDDDADIILYWSTFFDKYRSALQIYDSLGNASLSDKGDFIGLHDIFYIGQNISGVPKLGSEPPYPFKADGKVATAGTRENAERQLVKTSYDGKNADYDGSYMLGFAEAVGCDWFFGRNLKNPNNLAEAKVCNFATEDQSINSWLHERGNWGYLDGCSQADVRAAMPKTPFLFKPYLVLNTNDEPSSPHGEDIFSTEFRKQQVRVKGIDGTSPLDETEYKFVYGAADRIKGLTGDYETWKKCRREFVTADYRDKALSPDAWETYGHLEKGVGLAGLIEEYMRTNPEKANFELNDETADSLFAGSMKIADAVCQRFGYANYEEYLYDMSAKGIIGAQDIIDSFMIPEYATNPKVRYERQFPRYKNTNKMHLITGGSEAPDSPEETADEEYGDLFSDAVNREHGYANVGSQPEVQGYANVTPETHVNNPTDLASNLRQFEQQEQAEPVMETTHFDVTPTIRLRWAQIIVNSLPAEAKAAAEAKGMYDFLVQRAMYDLEKGGF